MNEFRSNVIIADQKDSTLLKFSDDADVADNRFEDNGLYGQNAKHGGLPQKAIKVLAMKPVLTIPESTI
jgi:hypothetical protein